MLYVGNKKWTKSLEAFLRTDNIFATEKAKREIEKLVNKGTNVYLAINPYLSAMHVEGEDESPQNHLLWDTDKDALSELCAQLAEDV